MNYIEFVGRTAEDAVKQACKEIGVSKDKLKYDVVSFGSTGIFGLVGSKKAKIRVHSLDSYPKKNEKQPDNEISDKKFTGIEKQSSQEPNSETPNIDNKPKTIDDLDDSDDQDDPILSDEYVLKGYDVLKRIVDTITDDATVKMAARRGQVYFHILGGNTAVLIGKHGQSLEAMQFLIDKIVNRTRFKQKVRVRIDVEGYLRVREENLTKLALRLGEKVIQTKRPETVSPMNANDRRIIHLALKDDNRLKTQSIGSGYYRKLVIFPYRGRDSDE
ncbi:MAG: Single-stranded nucleic acid binding R3H domain protein [Candidatus Magnetoglobus multicellularis str. Araruama]|uniref:RNA-binding protein KhpB n=1 Tax=Candidatus Magnetoglobus multicellularis str. Araruama TaxID=890399 RepID=A0A1V1PJ11_9BACT|nr:MAG: Single-stranded nucleic acid binding R3H domain protein [Candidatus Magnetoglobus multicellularis str. Araruama]